MDPSGLMIGLIALLFVIGVPVLAIAAFARVGAIKRKSEEETPQLISRIYGLEQRLGQIEKALAGLGGSSAAAEKAPLQAAGVVHPPSAAATAAVPASQSQIPSSPLSGAAIRSAAETSGGRSAAPPIPAAVPRAVNSPLSVPASSVQSAGGGDGNFEALVAGRWLNYIGILALLFAVTFFLKYAFDNNWVGPRGRVGIGLLLGSALYPWSHRLLDRGYEYFSEGIAGLGAAVLYLSLWAGWHYYHIFSQSTAFALMIVVTAATMVVAVGRNSERIAILALVGGLITPALVSTGENHEVALFTYLAILGAGVLGIAWVRNWKSLPPVQFLATLVYFWGWYNEFYRANELATTVLFATIFFILFAALPVVRSWRDGKLSGLEAGIVLVNSVTYLVALREMLWPARRWELTVAVLALAAAHLAAERMLPERRGAELRLARVLYAGLALTFATLAIPIRLDGKWITIAWAVQGVVLIWSGLRIRLAGLRWAGLGLFVIVAGRLALIPIPAGQFIWNARFATFAISVACFVLGCYFAATAEEELSIEETNAFEVTAIAANILAIVACSLEVWDLFGHMPSLGIDRGHAQELALSMLWLVWALGLLGAGLWKKSQTIRWQALVLLGVVIVKVFLFDLSFLEKFYRIVSFLLLGLALMLISFYYQRQLVGRKGQGQS
jgi:uncharacterized membrane protein